MSGLSLCGCVCTMTQRTSEFLEDKHTVYWWVPTTHTVYWWVPKTHTVYWWVPRIHTVYWWVPTAHIVYWWVPTVHTVYWWVPTAHTVNQVSRTHTVCRVPGKLMFNVYILRLLSLHIRSTKVHFMLILRILYLYTTIDWELRDMLVTPYSPLYDIM